MCSHCSRQEQWKRWPQAVLHTSEALEKLNRHYSARHTTHIASPKTTISCEKILFPSKKMIFPGERKSESWPTVMGDTEAVMFSRFKLVRAYLFLITWCLM